MNALIDEYFGFAQQFSGQDGDTGRPVPDLFVLHLGDIHEYLGGGIVDGDGTQNGGSVVGDANGLIVRVNLL